MLQKLYQFFTGITCPYCRSSNTSGGHSEARMIEQELSTKLDEARTMEEHYRALLLLWKKHRQELESQIPTENPWAELFEEAVADDDNGTDTLPA